MSSRLVRFSNTWFRYQRSCAGGVAPMFALAVIPVLGLVGAAVDYSHAIALRAAMQSAVDATALNLAKSASKLTQDQLGQQATNNFNADFSKSGLSGLSVDAQYAPKDKSLLVAASGRMKTDFVSIIGFGSIAVGVRAVAVPIGDGLLASLRSAARPPAPCRYKAAHQLTSPDAAFIAIPVALRHSPSAGAHM